MPMSKHWQKVGQKFLKSPHILLMENVNLCPSPGILTNLGRLFASSYKNSITVSLLTFVFLFSRNLHTYSHDTFSCEH